MAIFSELRYIFFLFKVYLSAGRVIIPYFTHFAHFAPSRPIRITVFYTFNRASLSTSMCREYYRKNCTPVHTPPNH